jgi:hypothetical protein
MFQRGDHPGIEHYESGGLATASIKTHPEELETAPLFLCRWIQRIQRGYNGFEK